MIIFDKCVAKLILLWKVTPSIFSCLFFLGVSFPHTRSVWSSSLTRSIYLGQEPWKYCKTISTTFTLFLVVSLENVISGLHWFYFYFQTFICNYRFCACTEYSAFTWWCQMDFWRNIVFFFFFKYRK